MQSVQRLFCNLFRMQEHVAWMVHDSAVLLVCLANFDITRLQQSPNKKGCCRIDTFLKRLSLKPCIKGACGGEHTKKCTRARRRMKQELKCIFYREQLLRTFLSSWKSRGPVDEARSARNDCSRRIIWYPFCSAQFQSHEMT